MQEEIFPKKTKIAKRDFFYARLRRRISPLASGYGQAILYLPSTSFASSVRAPDESKMTSAEKLFPKYCPGESTSKTSPARKRLRISTKTKPPSEPETSAT